MLESNMARDEGEKDMLEVEPGSGKKLLHTKGIRKKDGKFKVERRPPRFKQKFWLGTFNEEWQAEIAIKDYIAHCERNQMDKVCSPDWPTDKTLIEEFESLDPMCGKQKKQGKSHSQENKEKEPHCQFADKMRERSARIIREMEGLVINPETGEVILSYREVFFIVPGKDTKEQSCVDLESIRVDVDDCIKLDLRSYTEKLHFAKSGMPSVIFAVANLESMNQHYHSGPALMNPGAEATKMAEDAPSSLSENSLAVAEDMFWKLPSHVPRYSDVVMISGTATETNAQLIAPTTTANATIADFASLPSMITVNKVRAEGGMVPGFGFNCDDMRHGDVHIGSTQDPLPDSMMKENACDR